MEIQTPRIRVTCYKGSVLITEVVAANCRITFFPACSLLLVSNVALLSLIKMSFRMQNELAIVKMDWRSLTDFAIQVVSSMKAVSGTRSLKMPVGVLLIIS